MSLHLLFSLITKRWLNRVLHSGIFSVLVIESVIANSTVDSLFVVHADALHYTAQHTLSSNSALLVLNLPAERHHLVSQFYGPEKNTFQHAHALNPHELALWSGVAMTRYTHRMDSHVGSLDTQPSDLTVFLNQPVLNADSTENHASTITWILPSNAEVIAIDGINTTDNANNINSATFRSPHVQWQMQDQVLTYAQTHGAVPAIPITFRFSNNNDLADPCLTQSLPNDTCSPDMDSDGVPDYRDICLNTQAVLKNDVERPIDPLGCDHAQRITLNGVYFQSGQSYLDAASRRVLERVAEALKRVPKTHFIVASHTDNIGSWTHNLRLSENRADTTRHYLMLRGVGPNQLDARGLGEQYPIQTNRTASGRRENRRITLERIKR